MLSYLINNNTLINLRLENVFASWATDKRKLQLEFYQTRGSNKVGINEASKAV